jgi:hypothetical protein
MPMPMCPRRSWSTRCVRAGAAAREGKRPGVSCGEGTSVSRAWLEPLARACGRSSMRAAKHGMRPTYGRTAPSHHPQRGHARCGRARPCSGALQAGTIASWQVGVAATCGHAPERDPRRLPKPGDARAGWLRAAPALPRGVSSTNASCSFQVMPEAHRRLRWRVALLAGNVTEGSEHQRGGRQRVRGLCHKCVCERPSMWQRLRWPVSWVGRCPVMIRQ